MPFSDLTAAPAGETSATVRSRVNRARAIQIARLRRRGLICNSQMTTRDVSRYCRLDAAGRDLLESALRRLGLSARTFVRILKLARTIADLAGADTIDSAHLAEAIQYRALDRES